MMAAKTNKKPDCWHNQVLKSSLLPEALGGSCCSYDFLWQRHCSMASSLLSIGHGGFCMPNFKNNREQTRSGGSFAARFGRIILQDGIATVPSAMFHYQGVLEMSAQQVWLVSYILSHKWDEDLPYPSLKAMAKR